MDKGPAAEILRNYLNGVKDMDRKVLRYCLFNPNETRRVLLSHRKGMSARTIGLVVERAILSSQGAHSPRFESALGFFSLMDSLFTACLLRMILWVLELHEMHCVIFLFLKNKLGIQLVRPIWKPVCGTA